MPKIISSKEAASMIKKSQTVMFGGFITCGCAQKVIDEIHNLKTEDIHAISVCADTPEKGVGKLIASGQVKTFVTSHVGTNPVAQKLFAEGKLDVELVPQGTLIEQIRAKGSGLGGVLTQIGLNTIIENGKRKIKIDEEQYLLEKPLGADWAVIKAAKVDRFGNCLYRKTARNLNPVMAMGANKVIVEADEIVEPGSIDPETIATPGIFIDYIVQA